MSCVSESEPWRGWGGHSASARPRFTSTEYASEYIYSSTAIAQKVDVTGMAQYTVGLSWPPFCVTENLYQMPELGPRSGPTPCTLWQGRRWRRARQRRPKRKRTTTAAAAPAHGARHGDWAQRRGEPRRRRRHRVLPPHGGPCSALEEWKIVDRLSSDCLV